MDEWNKDAPEIGDDAIDQVYDDTGVHNAAAWTYAAADDSFEVEDAGAVEFETTLGDLDLTALPPQPNTQRGGTTPTKDGGGRPTRVRKPVSRLIPSF